MEASAAQNWSNLPIGAPWTPSMILGAQLHDRAQDEYYADLTRQNGALVEEVALCNIRLNAANTMATRQQVLISRFVFSAARLTYFPLQETIRALEQEVQFYRQLLAEQEQDQLATRIWGRSAECDLVWDKGILGEGCEPRPLTVAKVVSDIGLPFSPQQIHKLAILVHRAYTRFHGVSPRPRIFYNEDGIPERLCCYTEADRALILDAVYESQLFNEERLEPTINPPC